VLGIAVSARADERTLRLDPAACRVAFSLGATLHTAKGTLPVRSAEIRFDLETARASGRVVLDARAATTDSEGRDEKMHAEVLESARFPEIVFVPTAARGSLDPNGSGTVALSGTLEIHGTGHPFTVTAKVRTEGEKVTAEGAFKIPYVAWGMKDPSVFVMRVAKEVDVRIEAAGTMAPLPAGDRALPLDPRFETALGTTGALRLQRERPGADRRPVPPVSTKCSGESMSPRRPA
jgi:polyisoprenoid-binding protein YceI